MQCFAQTRDWRLPIPVWRVPISILDAEVVSGCSVGKGRRPQRGALWLSVRHERTGMFFENVS